MTQFPASAVGGASAVAACDAASTQTALIELVDVSVVFGRGPEALRAVELDLTIRAGEFVALIGPSGCGKSTILKLISGLLAPSSGTIRLAGQTPAARSVSVGMAFQHATIYPWLTVSENVMLPLKIVEPYKSAFRRMRRTDFKRRVDVLLAQVGLADFGHYYPWQLSGGMLQRASLCRALIHEPQLLLLDEPFGALDQFTREELWSVLQSLWLACNPTVLLVTHDLREALFLANRIIVMTTRPGRIVLDHAPDFAYPRTIDLTYSPRFVEQSQQLRNIIFRDGEHG